MPAEVKAKIQYLCKKIHTIEWSGILVYDIVGDVRDPKTCRVELKDIVPMDKGTSGYTTYKLDPKVVMKHFMERPEHEDFCIGHIHSHHDMSVFFSGTDTDELHENVPNHNVYLSLIVNNKNDWACKLVFLADVVNKISFLDKDGEPTIFGDEEPVQKMVVYDCEVVEEEQIVELDAHFVAGVERIDTFKPIVNRIYYGNTQAGLGFPRQSHGRDVASAGFKNTTSERGRRWWEKEEEESDVEIVGQGTQLITESDIKSYTFAMECLTLSKEVANVHGIAEIADSLATKFPTMAIPKVIENINDRVIHVYIKNFNDNQLIDFDTNIADVCGELNDALLEVTTHRGRVVLENFKTLLLQLSKDLSYE